MLYLLIINKFANPNVINNNYNNLENTYLIKLKVTINIFHLISLRGSYLNPNVQCSSLISNSMLISTLVN